MQLYAAEEAMKMKKNKKNTKNINKIKEKKFISSKKNYIDIKIHGKNIYLLNLLKCLMCAKNLNLQLRLKFGKKNIINHRKNITTISLILNSKIHFYIFNTNPLLNRMKGLKKGEVKLSR